MDTPEEVTVIESIHPESAWMTEHGPTPPLVPDAVVVDWELTRCGAPREGYYEGYVTVEGHRPYYIRGIRLGPQAEFTVDIDADQAFMERLNPDIDFSGPVPVAKNVAETSAPAPTTGHCGMCQSPSCPECFPASDLEDERPDLRRREKRPNPNTFEPIPIEPVDVAEPGPEGSLPTDSDERKGIPMARGLLDYFPDALAEVARLSQAANEKHNPGEPMHWARGKSMDHPDCIIRHLADRGRMDTDGFLHDIKVAWRALAQAQETLEDLRGLPSPRGAVDPDEF